MSETGAASRPSLAVVYGQPPRFSTSYQTTQLARALGNWFDTIPLPVSDSGRSSRRRGVQRVLSNYVVPMIRRPRYDYVLYANDGAVDLRHWRGRRVLYWYDAPWDYS